MSPCNCGGSGQWQPATEQAQPQAAVSGPAAPGYFSEAPKVWNGPQPAQTKPTS
jgi:hypothetical protein